MIFRGSSYRDVLFGTSDSDTLYGYSGDDAALRRRRWTIICGAAAGADLLDGGTGSDTAHYDDAKAA